MSHELSLKIKNIQIYLKIPMVITSRTLIILYSFSSIFSRKNSIHQRFFSDIGRKGDRHGERIKQLLEWGISIYSEENIYNQYVLWQHFRLE